MSAKRSCKDVSQRQVVRSRPSTPTITTCRTNLVGSLKPILKPKNIGLESCLSQERLNKTVKQKCRNKIIRIVMLTTGTKYPFPKKLQHQKHPGVSLRMFIRLTGGSTFTCKISSFDSSFETRFALYRDITEVLGAKNLPIKTLLGKDATSFKRPCWA